MFGPKELDKANTYKPNLQNIVESAERTYGEANSFFEKEELYMKFIEKQLLLGKLTDDKDIYDKSHAIASDLAKCCEMYLKALYLYENQSGSLTCEELWKILEAKIKEDKTKEDSKVRDKNGNIVYYQTKEDNKTPCLHPDGTVIYVYAKLDSFGNLVTDESGKQVYVDKYGNEYNESNKGSAVKTNGHALDRLIELLSPESKLLLETRMLSIPMDATEKNGSVSIIDKLQQSGIITAEEHISQEQFLGWLDQHKKTFEESRFSGQNQYTVNVEFLYHLATQIKAVVQYRMAPKNNQKFTVTEEELSKLPAEIKQLASFHSHLISEDLIKLVANDEEVSKKIQAFFSKNYILSSDFSGQDFYKILQLMNESEIAYTLGLCYMIKNYKQLNLSVINDDTKQKMSALFELAGMFSALQISSSSVIGFLIQVKESLKIEIGSKYFYKLIRVVRNNFVQSNYQFDIVDKKIDVSFDNKINYDAIDNNINTLKF